MANVKSAEKRNRQNQRRKARNTAARAKVKTISHKAMESIRANAKGATEAVREAASVLAKAAARGTIPKGRMARKTSRLMKAQNKATAAAK
jgi:small subunit ribosomal protein S20